MLQQLFYTLLIMATLGVLLVAGLYGPPAAQKVVHSVVDFLNWKPKQHQGPLNETEATIKEFNDSFNSIRQLRTMVVSRNKENANQLEFTYKEIRENLQQLLVEMDQQSVTNRAKLFDQFSSLHLRRKNLVRNLINDERTLINLNTQMDEQLRAVSAWLTQQAAQPNSPTQDEMKRGQQYQNLLNDLRAFARESNDLDVLRIVLMRKSAEFVDRLEASNLKLEENFSTLSSQIEIATTDQANGLWAEYDRLEAEQRKIVKDMRLNQDFIGDNQQKIVTGVSTVAKNIEYTTGSQLERFQQNYQSLEAQRKAALNRMEEQQRTLLDSRPTSADLKESAEYRAQLAREKTNQMLARYEELEEYRRSLSSTLDAMTEELRDNEDIASNQIENLRSTGIASTRILEARQRSEEAMARNLEKMEMIQSKMEAIHTRMDDVVTKELAPRFQANPYYIRLDELRARNKTTARLMHEGDDQLRSAQERQRSSSQALKDRMASLENKLEQLEATQSRQKDAMTSLQDRMGDAKERTQDIAGSIKDKTSGQSRSQKERIQSQMDRLRDQRESRRK